MRVCDVSHVGCSFARRTLLIGQLLGVALMLDAWAGTVSASPAPHAMSERGSPSVLLLPVNDPDPAAERARRRLTYHHGAYHHQYHPMRHLSHVRHVRHVHHVHHLGHR